VDKPLPDHLWDTEECAAYLNMSVDWLNTQRSKGTGPPYRYFGRAVRYVPDVVKAYVLSGLVSSTSEKPK